MFWSKFFFVIATLWVFTGLAPAVALAQVSPSASLFFAVPAGTFARGETFNVAARLSSAEETVNAAEGVINFSKDILEVTRITRAGSVFTLWPQEPVFSNQDGAVHFAGGLPNPGFKGTSAVIFIITFRGKAAGEAAVYFSSGTVLANDGFGSDITKTLGSARYIIANREAAPAIPPALKLPPAPVVFSSTHPDSSKWYAAREATLGWALPREVNGVSFLFDRQPGSIPEKSSQGLSASEKLIATEDGIWYFHLRFRNASAWGGAAHFKIQIDTEKPLPFSIFIKEDARMTEPQPTVIFEAADALSGIDYYAITIDDDAPIKWQKTEESPSFRVPQKLLPGKHRIVIKAFDSAGNFRTAEKEFEVVEAATPIVEFVSNFTTILRPVAFYLWLASVAVAAVIIISLIFIILYYRRRLISRNRRFSKRSVVKKP